MEKETKHYKCTKCGADNPVFQSRKAKWVLAGKIRAELSVGFRFYTTSVVDKAVPALQSPSVLTIEDICEDCGNIYVREIQIGTVTVMEQIVQSKKPRGFGL